MKNNNVRLNLYSLHRHNSLEVLQIAQDDNETMCSQINTLPFKVQATVIKRTVALVL